MGDVLYTGSRFGYEENEMRVYLLSMNELVCEENDDEMKAVQAVILRQQALKKLDTHRLEKVHNLKTEEAKNQAIGAGLLLQLAVQEKGADSEGIVELSVSEVLEKLHEAVEIEYVYNYYGKPDFVDETWHFNLSHSGEVVCLVTDKQPVGVDIQKMRPLKNYHLAERYFSERELSKLEACANEAEKVECFYDIWVKKEAYAKYTGEGIGRTVTFDTEDANLSVCWWKFDCPEEYRLAVCTAG